MRVRASQVQRWKPTGAEAGAGREGGAGVLGGQPDQDGVYAGYALCPVLPYFRRTLQPYLHFANGEIDVLGGEVLCI